MTPNPRQPLVSRTCHAAAGIFAFDRTLAQAFVQLDADVQVERVVYGRRADLRAWLALTRLFAFAVPVMMGLRLFELTWSEWRALLPICARLLVGPVSAVVISGLLSAFATSHRDSQPLLLFSTWFTLMIVWMLTAEAVERLPRRRLAATVVVLAASGAATSLATHLGAVPLFDTDGSLGLSQLAYRGLLHPTVAVATAWLSAQLALRGRRLWDEVSTIAVVGVVVASGITVIARGIIISRLSERELALFCVALVPLTLAVTAILTARIARHPIVEPGTRTIV
jgi:hypothetical protein